jgi:hypothetical protein
MKLALMWLPTLRLKDEGFVLETCPVGPGPPVGGMFTVKTGTGGLTTVLSVTE